MTPDGLGTIVRKDLDCVPTAWVVRVDSLHLDVGYFERDLKETAPAPFERWSKALRDQREAE